MNTSLITVPANNSTVQANLSMNSTQLFATLGYFWSSLFSDQPTVVGMTQAQTNSVVQGYYNLVDLINSYSCNSIPIFETRNWYPLFVYRSSLNNNELVFGEGVEFGADSDGYIFGLPVPEIGNACSLIAPSELQQASIIKDRIISPLNTWTLGSTFTFANSRITFTTNPFTSPNPPIPVQKVFNADGTPSKYYDYAAGKTVQDELMVLWVYNAGVESGSLKYNLGYLFGLNVPENANGKQALVSVMNNYTQGASVENIKAVALASVGLTIDTPGTVDLFDNVNTPNWWLTDLSLYNNGNPLNLPLILPSSMLLGNNKFNVSFTGNPLSLGFVNLNSSGQLSFSGGSVIGSVTDIANFTAFVNSSAGYLSAINNYLITRTGNALNTPGYLIGGVYSAQINMIDFMFQSFLKYCTALLRIRFSTMSQMANFSQYFKAIQPTLPPNVLFMVLCDLDVAVETMELNSSIADNLISPISQNNYYKPILTANNGIVGAVAGATTGNDIVHLNATSLSSYTGGVMLVADMLSIRTLTAPIRCEDIRNLSFTAPQ